MLDTNVISDINNAYALIADKKKDTVTLLVPFSEIFIVSSTGVSAAGLYVYKVLFHLSYMNEIKLIIYTDAKTLPYTDEAINYLSDLGVQNFEIRYCILPRVNGEFDIVLNNENGFCVHEWYNLMQLLATNHSKVKKPSVYYYNEEIFDEMFTSVEAYKVNGLTVSKMMMLAGKYRHHTFHVACSNNVSQTGGVKDLYRNLGSPYKFYIGGSNGITGEKIWNILDTALRNSDDAKQLLNTEVTPYSQYPLQLDVIVVDDKTVQINYVGG